MLILTTKMKPLELASKRYAVKKYDSSKKIPQEVIDELKQILRLTPSSIDIQPWKFIFVQDEKLKAQLAEFSKQNKEKITQAPLLIVFCYADNLEAFQKVVEAELPKPLAEQYIASKNTMSEAEIKAWFQRQLYISFGFALSSLIAMGIDSTPMEGIEPEHYIEILGLKDYRPLIAIAAGFASPDDYNRLEVRPKSRRPLASVIQEF